MKIYLVGGAIRDKLLGLPVKERDWVVVGASEADMLNLKFRQVGKEFPVFLHPKTKEEYALARKERKVGKGYTGFTFDTSPTVSLEEDLQRRDLTINAMAETEEGALIDPYHGKEDLAHKILRHVSSAFSEDPVRILRIGRFLARYASLGFQIAPETITLMQEMVAQHEVDALVAERVWKEWERAMGEPHPEAFFIVLNQCQAMAVLFPTLKIEGAGIRALINAAKNKSNTLIRFAALLHDMPIQEIKSLASRYKVPTAYRELASLTHLHYPKALSANTLSPPELLDLLTQFDIFRRPERFSDFLLVCEAIANTKEVAFDKEWLQQCAAVAKSVNVQILIDNGLAGNELALAIKEERRRLIEGWLKKD